MLTLEDNRLSQKKCYHIIPCAISEEMRSWTSKQLEFARRSGDKYKVLISVAQLTGPCVLTEDD